MTEAGRGSSSNVFVDTSGRRTRMRAAHKLGGDLYVLWRKAMASHHSKCVHRLVIPFSPSSARPSAKSNLWSYQRKSETDAELMGERNSYC